MAKIEKILEDTLFNNGSKEQVLPVTIDKAVGSTNIHKSKSTDITSLDNVISRLWYKCICFGVWENEDKENKNYYLFSTSNNRNCTQLMKYLNATTIEFKTLIAENSTNEEDLEKIETYTENIFLTDSDLQGRLQFKEVSSKYLQCVWLHNSQLPRVVVLDENGTPYENGSTIYFNKYPGVIKVVLRGTSIDTVTSTINNIITNVYGPGGATPSTGAPIAYGFEAKSYINDANEEVLMEFTDDLTSSSLKNPFPIAQQDGEINLSDVNFIIDYFLKDSFLLYIYPEDYPKISSELEDYMQYVKRGKISIKETVFGQGYIATEYQDNFLPIDLNIVFNPTSEFMFETNKTESNVVLSSANNYVSTVVIKGKFPEEESTVNIGFGEETDFEISLDGETYVDGYTTNLELTPEQIEEGVLVYIRPSNWENTENYTPYDSPVVDNVTLYCSYNGTEISKELTVNITYEVTAEDLHEDQMSVASDITPVEDNSERLGEIQLSLGNTIKALTFEKAEGYVFELALSQGSDGIVWNTFPSSITNIVVAYSTTIENGEYVNHSIINPGDVISAEELLVNNGVSIKLYVPVNDQNNHFIKGKGGIKVYLRDADGPYMYKVPITLIPDSMSSADLSDFTQWQQIAGLTESPQP